MSNKFEQWRFADRQAHTAEMDLWAMGVRGQHPAPPAKVALAKALRHVADRLFEEAIRELHAEASQGCRPAGRE